MRIMKAVSVRTGGSYKGQQTQNRQGTASLRAQQKTYMYLWTCAPSKDHQVQILRIRTVWSDSLLDAFWEAKDAKFLLADNEDPDQTVRMQRLIWVLIGRPCEKDFFSQVAVQMHYKNTPIQIYWKFYNQKKRKIFR